MLKNETLHDLNLNQKRNEILQINIYKDIKVNATTGTLLNTEQLLCKETYILHHLSYNVH